MLQDPSASLNPVFTDGDQIMETLHTQGTASRSEAQDRMVTGLHQRAMFALGITGRPNLLIADEPPTELDAVTVSDFRSA